MVTNKNQQKNHSSNCNCAIIITCLGKVVFDLIRREDEIERETKCKSHKL